MRRPLITAVAILMATVTAAALVGVGNRPLPPGVVADKIVVDKSSRTLTLLSRGLPLKTYKVSLGRTPVGKKIRDGDNRTPEGLYFIDRRNRQSGYHLALHVSYPNSEDMRQAKARGYSPGGDIMIHGLRNSFGWVGPLHRAVNWTRGCIAVTNGEIEEIDRAVPVGTAIHIQP